MTAHRTGFVALSGRPNVGKSTLMNRLVGEKIAIASPKPQTTRELIRGIVTGPGFQVVYVDTPGIHELARGTTKLNRVMVGRAVSTLREVDLATLVIDAAHFRAKPEEVREETRRVIAIAQDAGVRLLVALNKIDRIADKGELLPLIAALAELAPFEAIVPVSAREGSGVPELLTATRERLPEGPALFPPDELTDRPVRFLAAELLREQLFLALEQELPYQLAVTVDRFHERPDGLCELMLTVHVAKPSQKAIVIGKGGATLKRIGSRARHELEAFLGRRVFLETHVRVEERWFEREGGLRKLGYTDLAALLPRTPEE
jgi:GTP-binding protein Era